MRNHHEVELVYAPSMFGLFQPRFNPYSPFGNVVLRVVPPRPRIEDLILQLLEPDNGNTTPVEPVQTLPQDNSSSENAPNDDVSERMAREMQAEEDREQEMRDRAVALGSQFGNLLSSFFGTSHDDSSRSAFYQQPINAQAGPSTARTPKTEFSSDAGRRPLLDADSFSMMTEEVEPLIADELNVRAGKQRAQISSSFKLSSHSNPMELLDNMEAAFRHEVNKFNFPERLDFLDTIARDASAPGTPPSPVLSHASDNMSVRAHEQALSDLLANMDALANYEDEDVRMRQLQLGSKIRRELEELDRKVLEAWAASRSTKPTTPARTLAVAGMNRPEQFTKVDLTPKRHHGYAVLLFIFGTLFPPLAVAARFGLGGDFWLNLLLTICGYFPGHGHNFYIQNIRNNKNNRRTPKWVQRYGLVDTSEIERKKKRSQWASRYDERLPQSALEGQEYEEGQVAGDTPNAESGDPFARRNGDPTLWREEDENYYNGEGRTRRRANSEQSGSQSSISGRRWQYPANFNEATEVEGMELDGRKSKGKKKGSSSKRSKDKKDRWGRTADAHAGVGYEDVDGGRKKKKKKSRTTDDALGTSRRSDTSIGRRHSSVSDIEGPEDAVGGLYGERTALRSADSAGPRRNGDDSLNHQF